MKTESFGRILLDIPEEGRGSHDVLLRRSLMEENTRVSIYRGKDGIHMYFFSALDLLI